MFFNKGVDVSHALVFQYFVNGNQNARFLHLSKFVVDGGAKHTHRGAQTHIGIDEGRNVVAQFAYFCVEDVIVFLEIALAEEVFKIVLVCPNLQGFFGIDEVVFVAEVLVEEEENHVACLGIEGRIHRHLPEEVFQSRNHHRQCAQSVPEVVERKESFAQFACALIFKRHEGASQFHGVGQIVFDEGV